jgi:hypothetical protein
MLLAYHNYDIDPYGHHQVCLEYCSKTTKGSASSQNINSDR